MSKKIEEFRDEQGFIDLNALKKYKEKGESVGGTNAKWWFNVEGSRFLFKEYNEVSPAFGELLYYFVARMCGVNCAEYDLARYNGKVGTISYDFAKNKAYYDFLELISTFEDSNFSLSKIIESEELLKIYNNNYDNLEYLLSLLEEIELPGKKDALVALFTLDTLFIHIDRTLWNNGVLVDEETNSMELAPSYDNSHVLCLYKGKAYIEKMIEVLKEELSGGGSFSEEIRGDDSIDELIEFYQNSDEHTRSVIEGVIDRANIDKAIKEVKQIYKIDDILVKWAKTLLNFRRNTILSRIKSVRIDDDNKTKTNFKFAKRY